MKWYLLVLMLLPGFAAAQDVFGTATGCARHQGGAYTTDDAVLWVVGDRIEFHESSCPITLSQQVGSGATLLTLTCSGEGETWETSYMVETTVDPERFILANQEYPEIRTKLVACP